ncbi:MAG TPA: hypothetical protein VJ725_04760 [Thermoanaerobaculia bacterium]|nr:hypothetical protein [Thermoanaerobaculia bacterium]
MRLMPANPFAIYPYQWPILNPGPSWSVPRISMPRFFSIQWDFQIDSWYYIGHGVDAAGNAYTFNFTVGRYAFNGQSPSPQMAYFGFGVGSEAANEFHFGVGYGLDVSDDPKRPAALLIPPVGDFAYDLLFNGMLGANHARFRYTGGQPVGIIGAMYSIDAVGIDKNKVPLSASLELRDDRGTVLEGMSGCVAPLAEDDPGVYTYEVAQPRLTITGGTIRIGSETVVLTGGSLWHDRQAYTYSPYAPKLAALSGGSDEERIAAGASAASTLYRGMWLNVKLDSGPSMILSPMWAPQSQPGQQWISGRLVDRPPTGGYGNLFFAPDSALFKAGDGGAFLQGGDTNPATPWDFDVNIFDPGDPSLSPHWQSSDGPRNTYGTKWSVRFSERVQQWGVPPIVYLVALVESCENSLQGSVPFWEGAVRVYKDAACTEAIGYGFVEQMGYN